MVANIIINLGQLSSSIQQSSINQIMDVLNTPQDEVPQHLLSKDKKINARVAEQHTASKRRAYTNNILQLLHHSTPGYVQPEEYEQTVRVSQKELHNLVNVQSAASQFNLDLNFGDYSAQYTINGSKLLLTSSLGHAAIMDWRSKALELQINLKEQIRQAKFLHTDQLWAAVQNKNLFIYDKQGVELHKLPYSDGIEYLPYHFLLVSYCNKRLRFYDTSSGEVVADHSLKTKYKVMKHNPYNGVISLGTAKGTVEWWTPGMGTAALQLFVGGSIADIGFHKNCMITAADTIKVWDVRTLKLMDQYKYPFRRPNNISVSSTGMLGINYGYQMEFFKDCLADKKPYLRYKPLNNKHILQGKFVPFEDVMGLGLSKGFSSIVVPGSGNPNYSTFENSPFVTKKQQREGLVRKLLEKLAPETISVNPNLVGTVDSASKEVIQKQMKEQEQQKKQEENREKKRKHKTRGKDGVARRHLVKEVQKRQEKRRQMDKVYNLDLVARRAQKTKKQTEVEFLESLDEKGFDPVNLLRRKKIRKAE